MPVPEFNEIMAPALQIFADGKAHKISDLFTTLADHFRLTEDERTELLPSGKQRRWHNRANWACYDLFCAGLLDRPKKGLYVITDTGRTVADKKPAVINREYLMQFPQFVLFTQASCSKNGSHSNDVFESDTAIVAIETETPEEAIDLAYRTLRAALKNELLELVKKMDAFRFEQLVLDLLVKMGYGGSREEAAHVTRASGDEGIDGVINQDPLGLDVVYLQAKRWQKNIGRPEIQTFVGALSGQKAHKRGIHHDKSVRCECCRIRPTSLTQSHLDRWQQTDGPYDRPRHWCRCPTLLQDQTRR